MEHKYNTRNPAVKRLMREACELLEPTDEYCARPLDDNLFEWHFTVHGSPGSDFEGGVYHGRILFPADYPLKPPNIILLTPNGRFETNKKICLSISGHHPETWQPGWSIRTALLALIAFMSSPGNGAIGSLDYTPEERKLLAKKSQNWECSECGKVVNLLSSSKLKPVAGAKEDEEENEESDLVKAAIHMKTEDLTKEDSELEAIDDQEATLLHDFTEPREHVPSFNEEVSDISHPEELDIVSSSDSSLRNLMWAIITAIVLLIARRLFLL